MTPNLKTFFALGIITISIPLISMSPSIVQMAKVKYKVIHNGQTLCLPKPGYDAHIREHDSQKSFTCIDAGMCGDEVTTPPPPTEQCQGCQRN